VVVSVVMVMFQRFLVFLSIMLAVVVAEEEPLEDQVDWVVVEQLDSRHQHQELEGPTLVVAAVLALMDQLG
jgi:hypothetical protein